MGFSYDDREKCLATISLVRHHVENGRGNMTGCVTLSGTLKTRYLEHFSILHEK